MLKNITFRSLLAYDCNFHILLTTGVWLLLMQSIFTVQVCFAYFSDFPRNSKAISTLCFCFPWKSVPHKTISWNSISSCKPTKHTLNIKIEFGQCIWKSFWAFPSFYWIFEAIMSLKFQCKRSISYMVWEKYNYCIFMDNQTPSKVIWAGE